MSLDTPPSITDPNLVVGATSLRARYNVQLENRNDSTDEQLDGESFRLSRRPSGSSDPTTCSPLTRIRSDQIDSDAEVDVVVRKASSQHREVPSESIRMDGSQHHHQNIQTTIQAPAQDKTRGRSKTIASIPQNPNSFVKLAQEKLLRMESNSSFSITAPSSISGCRNDSVNLTSSPSITTNHQPYVNSQSSPGSIPEELVMMQALGTAGRVQSAPVRREKPIEQSIRPDAQRSQSDTVVMSSPTKAGSDKSNDVRKRIEELEAKMRGGASR